MVVYLTNNLVPFSNSTNKAVEKEKNNITFFKVFTEWETDRFSISTQRAKDQVILTKKLLSLRAQLHTPQQKQNDKLLIC